MHFKFLWIVAPLLSLLATIGALSKGSHPFISWPPSNLDGAGAVFILLAILPPLLTISCARAGLSVGRKHLLYAANLNALALLSLPTYLLVGDFFGEGLVYGLLFVVALSWASSAVITVCLIVVMAIFEGKR